MESESSPSQFIVSDVGAPVLQLLYAVFLCNTFTVTGWSTRSKLGKLFICPSTPLSRIFHKFKQNKQTVTSSYCDKHILIFLFTLYEKYGIVSKKKIFITTEGCGSSVTTPSSLTKGSGLRIKNGVTFHGECFTPQSGTSRNKSGLTKPQSR